MADATNSLGGADVSKAFQDSLTKANDALSRHDYKDGEETSKLFGLFEMDSGLVSWATALYNAGVGIALKNWSPRTYGTIRNYAGEYLKGSSLDRTAAGSTFALNTALYVLPHAGEVISQWQQQHKERNQLVHTLAPVLDEIKGHHSLAAFYAIKENDNEVIFAQRRRMLKMHHANNVKQLVGMLVKIVPNLVANESDHFMSFMEGRPSKGFMLHTQQQKLIETYSKDVANELGLQPKQINLAHLERAAKSYPRKYKDLSVQLDEINPKPKTQQNQSSYGSSHDGMSPGTVGFLGLNLSITPIVDKYIQSSQRRLQKTLQPYSALEMILELEKQIKSGNTDGFTLPGNSGESLPLEAYIAQIIIQHQKDMADLDPRYTPIREALHKDLEKTVQPIADTIRSGDLDAIALVRLVGEGHIIKGKGRSLADAATVGAIVDKMSGKKQASVTVDPKEYFSESPFTKDDLKVAIENLDGEERSLFAAMFSDDVLKEAGVEEKEIKSIRDSVKKDIYEHMVATVLAGVPVEETEKLKKDGLAEKEITRISEGQSALSEEGEEAIHKLKTSPVNTDGIEHSLVNLLVTKVKGDRAYFGKLRARGEEKLREMPAPQPKAESNDNDAPEGREHEQKPHRREHTPDKYAQREEHRRGANDDEDTRGLSA